jgi:hypothetical protein
MIIIQGTQAKPSLGKGRDWQSLTPRADATGPGWLHDVARAPTFTEAHRTSPARPASTESDVVVPLLQSLITGVIVGLPVGTFVALAFQWPWWSAPAIAIGAVIPAVWLHRLGAHSRALWTVEKIFNRDVDGDSFTGEPPRQSFEMEVKTGRTIQRFDMPGRLEQFYTLARGILRGKPFSEHEWTPQRRLYSVPTFRQIRSRLLELRYIEWVNPMLHFQGLRVTDRGHDFMESFVEQWSPTT